MELNAKYVTCISSPLRAKRTENPYSLRAVSTARNVYKQTIRTVWKWSRFGVRFGIVGGPFEVPLNGQKKGAVAGQLAELLFGEWGEGQASHP